MRFQLWVCFFVAMAVCTSLAQRDILVLNLQLLPPPPDKLAIQVCCGLFNRIPSGSSCYIIVSSNDIDWLSIVAPHLPSPPHFTPMAVFMRECFAIAASNAIIEFDYAAATARANHCNSCCGAFCGPLSPFVPLYTPITACCVQRYGALAARHHNIASHKVRLRSMVQSNPHDRNDESWIRRPRPPLGTAPAAHKTAGFVPGGFYSEGAPVQLLFGRRVYTREQGARVHADDGNDGCLGATDCCLGI